ncbi:MAG TPA: leucyl aminopeptidase [Mycobacteriales bacterium]|jgi:leucyl aminopeptidase|nr:leucyl aminopeptidase [Mycobacteriales bacterium]
MTAVTLTKTTLSQVKADAIIVGLSSGRTGPTLVAGAADVDKAFKKQLLDSLKAVGATGKAGEITTIASLGRIAAPALVAVGLGPTPGKGERYDVESIRRAVGAAVRSLAGRAGRVATGLSAANAGDGIDELRAVAEGAHLGGYGYNRYRTAASRRSTKKPVGSAVLVVDDPRDKKARAVVERAAIIGEAVSLARDLINTPPGDLRPDAFAQAAVDACTAVGCDVDVMDEKALTDGGFGGILGVGAGSSNPPRLVRIGYSAGRSARSTVHLVGKGITFDSGGLSLKTAQGMEWMKSDMGGAAAVIATMRAIAQLKPAVNVVGWLPTAENMPSGHAIRPSDVLTMHGGKTVEVLNTDAEGRLILADAISRAAEENPDIIIDIATLTGAQLVALGSHVYAVMANDDALRSEITAAAGAAGEQAWPMPLPAELRKSLDSEVADIANTGDRYGGMLTAGLFLKEFVPDGIRWAHLDIAGPSYNQGEPHGYTPKGGTGVPVRSLVEFLETLAG